MIPVYIERVEIGATLRAVVKAPFAMKDAIKRAGAQWEKPRKIWTVPLSAISIENVIEEIKRTGAEIDLRTDPCVRDLLSLKTRVSDVSPGEFAFAKFPPRPYQRIGSSCIGNLSGFLVNWDMRTGKTKAVYDAIVEYRLQRIVIACPVVCVRVWAKEAKKHVPEDFPLRVVTLDSGVDIKRRAKNLKDQIEQATILGESLLVAVNLEAIWREPLASVLLEEDWDLLGIDEIHRVADHRSRSTKFLRSLAPRCRRRIGLTGTLLDEGMEKAFAPLTIIEPGLFGESITRFRSRYCMMGGFNNHQVVDYQNKGEFAEKIARISTTVKLRDVIELVGDSDEEIEVSLSADAMRIYRSMWQEFAAHVGDGVVTASNALAKLLRLQQITSGFAPVATEDGTENVVSIDSAKRDAAEGWMADIDRSEPLVVGCRFIHDIDSARAAAAAAGRPSFEISGREKDLPGWEKASDRGLGPVLACQIRSGGIGVDLTRARYCLIWSIGFSLIDYKQFLARTIGPDQKRSVVRSHLIAMGTVDRYVYRVLGKKSNLVDEILGMIRGGAGGEVGFGRNPGV